MKKKIVKPTYIGYSYGCGFDTYDVDSEEVLASTVEQLISEIDSYLDVAKDMVTSLSSYEEDSDECSAYVILYDDEEDLIRYGSVLEFENGEIVDSTHKNYKQIFKNLF